MVDVVMEVEFSINKYSYGVSRVGRVMEDWQALVFLESEITLVLLMLSFI
jgi:hypothetical protein